MDQRMQLDLHRQPGLAARHDQEKRLRDETRHHIRSIEIDQAAGGGMRQGLERLQMHFFHDKLCL